MEGSGAILCQISSLKEMLDQVNEEMEANIQITREIESEIVKCSEFEKALAVRESELTKTLYISQFEIIGLLSVTDGSRKSVKVLEEELCNLRRKRDETLTRINEKREEFITLCLEFEKEIDKGNDDELRALLSEKEFLEDEILLLEKKNNTLKNSMLAFVEEILEDLHTCNSVLSVEQVKDEMILETLQFEVHNGCQENQKLLKDIAGLKTRLLSSIIIDDDLR
ncbi:hypothetical protein FEM48_Zijuj05G0109700 [Ziziphus jujuba var. spinosa]|uniref:Uncharacterized protein n=1 Tax=Ziziphus jujuba var. spinosa TaxID=714518 RepID=A0A978VEK1_ZIZJJ|nr:hypothetical protein FEM48_Zijuj05G0109700 [Ziziphus jujuba var. spinosa]